MLQGGNGLATMRICAVIVVYNPDISLLRENISRFIDKVERLLVWENSQIADGELFTGGGHESWREKTEFCGDGTNVGISKALNYAWHYAREHGYTHLMTMDQDSLWEHFDAFVEAVGSPAAPKGYYGPLTNNAVIDSDFVRRDTFLITSGMLVPLEILEATGGYNEEFFVDEIDVDFCFHARQLGYDGYLVRCGHLIQRFGDTYFKKFLGRKYTVQNYPPQRLYGIYRNFVIVFRRYKVRGEVIHNFIESIRQRPVRILLGEKDKLRKIAAIIRGLVAGMTYRL